MADLEDFLYKDVLRRIPLQNPIFITALPRSGTTILLHLLATTDHFASHTYRDMPFVLCPMLWQRFSQHFSVFDSPVERAHGDGLQVSANSPEAFEEMVWKHFWPDHYAHDRIRPWTSSEQNLEFDAFLGTHMRKIIAVRRHEKRDDHRYLSKNNSNIARVACPPEPLKDGTFLIPFREPIQHAASLLKQHRRFLKIHQRDDFVREYMEAIGHHEFGGGLKPVNFNGWLENAKDPDSLEFWVRYWIAAYRHLVEHVASSRVLVSYQRLTDEPVTSLGRIADIVDIPPADLVTSAKRLHSPRTHEVDANQLPTGVLDTALELERQLDASAVV